MKNKLKKSITLAEIMIVLVIVAIVIGVFLAMPKKNVSQMDKAKYYVAYNTLKRMMDEQIAQGGHVGINHNICFLNDSGPVPFYTCDLCEEGTCTNGIDASNNPANNESFDSAVRTWLNVQNVQDNRGAGGNIIYTLTNGVQIIWDGSNATECNTTETEGVQQPFCLTVTMDIDGPNKGTCVPGQDCHDFILDSTGTVMPTSGTDWITFKVYHIDNSSKVVYDSLNQPFIDAFKQYCCLNGGIEDSPCSYVDDGDNIITLNEAYCTNPSHYYGWNNGSYFIEAHMPLK